jgi:peptidoglycan hydrolase-like protein with peptidoglycan-binding domain
VFQSNLTVGSLGSEVKALQELLNTSGYTVATSGAGSPGNETTKFGAATRAALVKYQQAKGITPASGYFGPLTRAAVNAGN